MRKNPKEKKLKLPIKRIISNNIFMLKLIHSAAPWYMPMEFLFTILSASLSFMTNTWLLRYALNGIGKGYSFERIATTLLLCLAFNLLINAAQSWFYNIICVKPSANIDRDIRKVVYKKAKEVELGCYENPKYYDKFVKAIGECASRPWAVINSIGELIYRLINISANIVLLIVIDPVLILFLLIPLLAIPLQSKSNKLNYNKNMELAEENRRCDYSRRAFYLADYAKEMRLTDMPHLMLRRFKASGERIIAIIQKYGLKVSTLSYISDELNQVFCGLGATFYAAWKTFGEGTMGYGDCIVIVNSIDSVSYTLISSANVFLRFQENALYIENLREFLDYESTIKDGSSPMPQSGDIVLNNVSFRYDGASDDTLHDISMHFGQNEKIAIVGHNGAGKSTLVKLLLRLYDASGSITYGGTDIKDLKVEEYREIFCAVMQEPHVFALSLAENVLLRRKCEGDDRLVSEALEKGGLSEKVASFASGSDTIMTREFDPKGELLSGGEAQKLAISHIYTKENRFVILDEPSSALDPIAEYEMYKRMTEACRDCGMIFISHRLSSAVMADRIYLMENGRVAECGSHSELMEKNGIYADMFRKQAENYAETEVIA